MTERAEQLLLGFDFGTKRIGIAIGQTLSNTARPLATLPTLDGGPDWAAITALLEQWQPDALVVGLPLDIDDSEQEMTRLARRFGNRLNGRYNLPVHWIGEGFSSMEAEQRLRERDGTIHDKGEVDRVAAAIILQSWLEGQPQPESNE